MHITVTLKLHVTILLDHSPVNAMMGLLALECNAQVSNFNALPVSNMISNDV